MSSERQPLASNEPDSACSNRTPDEIIRKENLPLFAEAAWPGRISKRYFIKAIVESLQLVKTITGTRDFVDAIELVPYFFGRDNITEDNEREVEILIDFYRACKEGSVYPAVDVEMLYKIV